MSNILSISIVNWHDEGAMGLQVFFKYLLYKYSIKNEHCQFILIELSISKYQFHLIYLGSFQPNIDVPFNQ